MIDPFGRQITYLRVSVTDRCDLRCVYCMAEDMTFLPKAEVLTLEELDRLCGAFIGLGVEKIRLTGGEPLVRKGVIQLFRSLGARLGARRAEGADGHHQRHAARRRWPATCTPPACGASTSRSTRLDPATFAALTRWGKIEPDAGRHLRRQGRRAAVKINAVALKGVNEDEFDRMIAWCGEHGFDLCLIETMPLGEITGDRTDQYLPLSLVRAPPARALDAAGDRLHAPAARRATTTVKETGRRIGFITPMTHNFCEILQPRAADLHRHAVHVPRPGRRGRSARAAARPVAGRGGAARGHPGRRSRASRRGMTSSSTAAAMRPPWRAT